MPEAGSTNYTNPINDAGSDGSGEVDLATPISPSNKPRRDLTEGKRSCSWWGRKLKESFASGVDPYVLIYEGHARFSTFGSRTHMAKMSSRKVHVVRTKAVPASDDNDNGHAPAWTHAENNCMELPLSKNAQYVTVEVWDSDLDADDFLGGCLIDLNTLDAAQTVHSARGKLDKVRAVLASLPRPSTGCLSPAAHSRPPYVTVGRGYMHGGMRGARCRSFSVSVPPLSTPAGLADRVFAALTCVAYLPACLDPLRCSSTRWIPARPPRSQR
jgi:hypothetical protein